MALILKTFSDEQDLSEHIKTHAPTLYVGSQTSTVIPYDKLEVQLKIATKQKYYIGHLSKLPPLLELLSDQKLRVKGAVNWQEARAYLRSKGRDLMTSPTEELALVLSGLATSATGERCFGFGNLRKQVASLSFLNHEGARIELKRQKTMEAFLGHELSPLLKSYQLAHRPYQSFKNAPWPCFEQETDLMIGTEGQLGVITEAVLDTTALVPIQYLFLLLPRWEDDDNPHLEIFQRVQNLRGKILSVELLDANGMNYLKPQDRLGNNEDVLFLEVLSSHFEEVFEKLLESSKAIKEDKIFEISEDKYHHVRASVPRAIFEENSRKGVIKKGTDVQVRPENFAELLGLYRKATKLGMGYTLFGHFGDAHLHFNFMPVPEQVHLCDDYFVELYDKVLKWKGSPFAEHGIGIIKQKFIKKFHQKEQQTFFHALKSKFDPHKQFFPQGFMGERL